MKVKIESLRYPFDREENLFVIVGEYLGISSDRIRNVRILKKSLDARKNNLSWVVSLEVTIEGINQSDERRIGGCRGVSFSPAISSQRAIAPLRRKDVRAVIAGCGPAGIFAALTLVKRGVKPVIIERGGPVEERLTDVGRFWREGALNEESNVQFGEGGAGAFSDGKLTTRIKDPRKNEVLAELVKAGAPEEITYLNRPHLGSDNLIPLVRNLREKLLGSNVEIRFNTRLVDLIAKKGKLEGIETTAGSMEADMLFLAIGHSARDTYEMLYRRGISMNSKAFAVGFRVEHPQKRIDLSRYKQWAFHPRLGAADYFFTFSERESRRGVYTFCMCPGGYVIAGSSERETVTTNGMSNSLRNSQFGNAAVVVTVGPGDFGSNHPLAGIYFQRELEKRAFTFGGGSYYAPVQRVKDFLQGEMGEDIIQCTYRPGIKSCNLQEMIPSFLLNPLRNGIRHFETKMKGFIQEGVLISVETRTSAPVRVVRDDKNYNSLTLPGLIPVGEGSGYAGGIVSSAVDGVRAAERFDLT